MRNWNCAELLMSICIFVLIGMFMLLIGLIICLCVNLDSKTYESKGTFIEVRYNDGMPTTVTPITTINTGGGIGTSLITHPGSSDKYISAIRVDGKVYEADSKEIYYYCTDLKKGTNVNVVITKVKHPFLGWDTYISEVDGVKNR